MATFYKPKLFICRFKWNLDHTNNATFSIYPVEGYTSPGTTVLFTVKYHPKNEPNPTKMDVFEVCNNIKILIEFCIMIFQAHCNIEGYTPGLHVKLTGTCVDTAEPVSVLQFMCPVREEDLLNVQIHNPYVNFKDTKFYKLNFKKKNFLFSYLKKN